MILEQEGGTEAVATVYLSRLTRCQIQHAKTLPFKTAMRQVGERQMLADRVGESRTLPNQVGDHISRTTGPQWSVAGMAVKMLPLPAFPLAMLLLSKPRIVVHEQPGAVFLEVPTEGGMVKCKVTVGFARDGVVGMNGA